MSRAAVSGESPADYRKTYVGDLPYRVQKGICEYVDADKDAWRELGELMNFPARYLDALKTRTAEGGLSRTKTLLEQWSHGNHTADELFRLLKEMGETRAMRLLLPYVKKDLHKYMESEDFTMVLKQKKQLSKPSQKRREANRSEDDSDGEIPSSEQYLRKREPPSNQGQAKAELDVNRNDLNASASRVLPEKHLGNASRSPNIRGGAGARYTRTENSVAGAAAAPATAAASGRRYDGNMRAAIGKALEGLILVDFPEMQEATNFFADSNVIGRGGFGTVFRGTWKHTPVAVKRIEPRHQTGDLSLAEAAFKQSLVELKMSSQYKHPNILQLYAYSMDTALYLIFEFMPNGSLEDRLLCKRGSPPLDCRVRLSIASGVAAGIQFLHTVVPTKPLIHGDIKSANILLDPGFQPKLGDFGLAREGPDMATSEMTHIQVSRVRGTKPYLPDEYLKDKDLSPKVDTYSFGIVLLEISTGRRAWDEKRLLRDWVEERVVVSPLPQDLLDRRAGPEGREKLLRLLKIGLQCAARKKEDRPAMVRVYEELRDYNSVQDRRTRQISLPASLDLDRGQLTPYEQSLLLEHQRLMSASRSPLPSWAFQHGSFAGMQTPGFVPSGGGGTVSPHVLSTASIPSALANQFGVRQPMMSSAGRSSNDPRLMARPGYPLIPGSGLLRPIARHQPPLQQNFFLAQNQQGLTLPTNSPLQHGWQPPPQVLAPGSPTTNLSTQSNNAAPPMGAVNASPDLTARPPPSVPAAAAAPPVIPVTVPPMIPSPAIPATFPTGGGPLMGQAPSSMRDAGGAAASVATPNAAPPPPTEAPAVVGPIIPDFAALNIGGSFGPHAGGGSLTQAEDQSVGGLIPTTIPAKTNSFRPMLTVLLSGDKSTETKSVAHPREDDDEDEDDSDESNDG